MNIEVRQEYPKIRKEIAENKIQAKRRGGSASI
jgi:hypothetical protein